jgi:hypothetical protein
VHAVTQADDASEGMAAGKLREAAARGNLQEVLRLIEEGAKIQTDEVSICTMSLLATLMCCLTCNSCWIS